MSDEDRYQRWTCPGRLCGTYEGYQRGCRGGCVAAVAPHQAARRERRGSPPRAPLDDARRRALLDALRGGASLAAACAAVGVSDFRVRAARRADPRFDAAVMAASPAVRPLRPLNCPGADCAGLGYRYGCRDTPCSQAHQAAMDRRPRSGVEPLHRFDAHEAYLAALRAGRTVREAADQVGYEYSAVYYARLNDPRFDAAVVRAAAEGTPPGRPGPRPRHVHRQNQKGARHG